MLKKKMFRDIMQNKSQFITIFLMVTIGVMVYAGIESYMSGMTNAADKFYLENNLQDLNVLGTTFTEDDLLKIKQMKNVNDAERKLEVTGIDADDKDKTYLISFIESNNISKFYVTEGSSFDVNKKGVWIDSFYADKNDIKIKDKIRIKYDNLVLEEEVLGFVNIPDHIYDIKDEKEIVPDREKFGIVYMSKNEIPKEYIETISQKMGINKDLITDDNYQEFIPYNYIMVDVDNKNNCKSVKNDIEENVSNALAVINIEDTASYRMYQGEIDEGKAYVGVFSGLFLFIAVLSVVTTMTRIVKKQKIQIGTLKALGFKKNKILLHYIGYGFWVSFLAAIFGILLGKYFIGTVFMNIEMSFFEVPNGVPIIESKCYVVALLTVLLVSLITYLTCYKELRKIPAESLRKELPKVKNGSLNITTKGIFKKCGFETKWNLRDIIRNKIRTLTAVAGIVGCCTLIVCAFGMLNSMNNFIKLQFEELYNFKYKLSLKETITESELDKIENNYGKSTSETLQIEYVKDDESKVANTIFVTDASDLVQFKDKYDNYIKINSSDGVYVTEKMKEENNYNIGDEITWHIYGDKNYYKSQIIGFNRDPQNQNITATRQYIESLNIKYKPDSLYTNADLKDTKELEGVGLIQNIDGLKESMQSMLSMMKSMIMLIICFAILLGAVIIYNMGILSYSEKQYQFATLKVLGFKDKKIRNIYIKQNLWITIMSIIIGLPSGYYLTSWLFKACLDDNFDFSVHINLSTYIIATIGTFIVSYLVSSYLSRKVNKIDMVSSLKGDE